MIRETTNYNEEVKIPSTKDDEDVDNIDVVVRSLKQPTCIKCDIVDGKIEYTVEKEMGVEIVGDVKVKIAYDSTEDPWDSLSDSVKSEDIDKQIDNEVKEEYLD